MKSFRYISLFLIAIFQINTTQAQVFTTKKDTILGTELTFSADRNVSRLIEDLESKCANKNNWLKDNNNSNNSIVNSSPKRKLSNAEICRQNPRILGVKIQLALVKSKKEADEVALYFRRRFPYIKVQQDASLRPNYKVLAGSYFTKEDAAKDLRSIRVYFKNAVPVKYMIFCAEAL